MSSSSSNMFSSWAANATQALERTGDAISKAATNAGKNARSSSRATTEGEPLTSPTIAAIPPAENKMLSNLSKGWNNVVETTKKSVAQAEQGIKQQQKKLETRITKARNLYHKRDIKLPLDVPALKDANVVYITDRIITMSHPAVQTSKQISAERKLAAVGHLLQRRHAGKFMVWNMSELNYDIDVLDDQVLTYSFPGSPSPPLGLLLKLLVSMESWLKADDRNVAVLHCLTGKGRTSLVLAAFLCWMGEAGFGDVSSALEYIARAKQIAPDQLTIPSQRRYAGYFKNMLESIRPSQPPILLSRIIMSQAPKYAKGPRKENCESDDDCWGCVPYIQLFKAGKLLHTAPASLHFQQDENELPFCNVADGNISFHVNAVIQGDILVRARHLTPRKTKISMFRAAFHTGYTSTNMMRLTVSQLDGACDDERFCKDFFLDFIFENVDAESAKTQMEGKTPDDNERKVDAVTASVDDTMLHRDSHFWDVIAKRKTAVVDDALAGPTIGKRRDYKQPKETNNESKDEEPVDSFSIGDYDFLPELKQEEEEPKKKDTLMEALMGALDDDDDDNNGTGDEEIVFENSDNGNDDDDKKPAADTKAATDTEADDVDTDLAELLEQANIDDADLAMLDNPDEVLSYDIDDSDLDDLESFLTKE